MGITFDQRKMFCWFFTCVAALSVYRSIPNTSLAITMAVLVLMTGLNWWLLVVVPRHLAAAGNRVPAVPEQNPSNQS